MKKVGRPRTKVTTDIVAYQREYQKEYQQRRRDKIRASRLWAEAAIRLPKTMFTFKDIQDCPPEKMDRLVCKMTGVIT